MVTTYAGLYSEAEKVEDAIQGLANIYDVAIEAPTTAVFASIDIERQLVSLREAIVELRKVLISEAFDEGELVFTPRPAPEGSENVQKNDNIFLPNMDATMAHISSTIGRSSPVRMTSIL